MPPQVFLSYSHQDSTVVQLVLAYLKNAGLNVWIDQTGIEPGTPSWRNAIQNALDEAGCLVVIFSPDSKQSKWVGEELNYAEARGLERFPILAQGDEKTAVPFGYTASQWIDIRDETRFDPEMEKLVGAVSKHLRLVGEVDSQDLAPRLAEQSPNPLAILAVRRPPYTLSQIEWISIPAGNVTLDDKAEPYKVEPFAIGKYSVTYAQFQAFIDDGGYSEDRWWRDMAMRLNQPKQPSWPVDNHPRETVSWYEAMAFCHWLSNSLGQKVTLPTEMQWQRAAQGEGGAEYPWGERFDKTKCNTSESGIGQSTPVDHYPAGASPFGVMDMSGNVWEWCINEFANPGNIDIRGEVRRMLRGGSWFVNHKFARASNRNQFNPVERSNRIGFRLVGPSLLSS